MKNHEEVIRSASTTTLIGSLLIIDAQAARTPEERRVSSWITSEIESRYPEVGAAMEAWSEDVDTELTYAEALVLALPEAAIRG